MTGNAAGAPVDRSGSGPVAEVYPAASLHSWGLTHHGYKQKTSTDALGKIPLRAIARIATVVRPPGFPTGRASCYVQRYLAEAASHPHPHTSPARWRLVLPQVPAAAEPRLNEHRGSFS